MKYCYIYSICLLCSLTISGKVIKLSSLKLKSSSCSSPSDITEPIQNGLGFIADTLECFTFKLNPFSLFTCGFTAASSFVGLLGSIFGFGSDPVTTCQLDAKLDQIIRQLNEISLQLEDISLMFQCQQVKNDYEKMTLKLNNMMNLIYEYSQNPSNQSKVYLRSALRSICIDNSEGLNNILGSIFYLLSEGPVNINFKTCGQYKSTYIDQWAIEIQKITFMFVFLVKGCEEAYEYESEYNKTDFINVVKDKVEYHRNYTGPKYFYDDNSSLGLNFILQQKVKEGKKANETQAFLQQNYGYLNWQVIYYPNNLAGYARHKWIGFRQDSMFGSKWYTGENQTDKNAIIAWSHPAAVQTNNQINFNFNLECIAACWVLDDFVSANVRASITYAFIASDSAYISIDKYGDFAYLEKSRACGISYPTYLFASIYSPPMVNNSNFKNRAIVLPDLSAKLTSLKTYWKMESLKDSIRGISLAGINYSFVTDRLNRSKSAIYLNNTYLNVPPGLYFNNEFTITAWIFLKTYKSANLIYFSDPESTNYVKLSFEPNYKLSVDISSSIVEASFNSSLLDSWHHLAFSLRSGKGSIYIDGILKTNSTKMNGPQSVNTTSNFIGGDDSGRVINAIIDELRFYSGTRTGYEIMDEYLFGLKK